MASAPGKADPDVSALLAGSFSTRIAGECWALKADGVLKEYLDALRAEFVQGHKPVWNRVVEQLETHFDIRVTYSTVKRHIERGCRCPK